MTTIAASHNNSRDAETKYLHIIMYSSKSWDQFCRGTRTVFSYHNDTSTAGRNPEVYRLDLW